MNNKENYSKTTQAVQGQKGLYHQSSRVVDKKSTHDYKFHTANLKLIEKYRITCSSSKNYYRSVGLFSAKYSKLSALLSA